MFDQIEERNLNSEDVIGYFKKKFPGEDVDVVFGVDSDYDKGRQVLSL